MFVVTSTIFHLHNMRNNRRKCNLQIFCIWCFIFTFKVQEKFLSYMSHLFVIDIQTKMSICCYALIYIKNAYSNTFLLCFLPMMACSQNSTKSFPHQKNKLEYFSNMQESTKCVNNCVLLIDCINQVNCFNKEGGY